MSADSTTVQGSSKSSIQGNLYRLEFSIPGIPKTHNAHREKGQWARYKHDNEWKDLVGYMVNGKKPPKSLSKFTLTLIRHSSAEPDYDGLVSTFKAVVDGLKLHGVIVDDKLKNTGPWDCRWEKAKPKFGYIEVIVQERVDYSEAGL